MIVAGLLLLLLSGFLLARAAWPGRLAWEREDWLRLPIGFWIAAGLTSIPAFLWPDRSPVTMDLALLAVSALAFAIFGRRATASTHETADPAVEEVTWRPALWLAGAVALTAGVAYTLMAHANPQGDLDAWRLWNFRPLYLFRGATLRDLADPLVAWSHPESPYLLSASVLRLWQWAGSDTPLAPTLLSACFAFTLPMAVYGLVLLTRRRTQALLAMSALAASSMLFSSGWGQLADLPLAAFVFGAFAILCLREQAPPGAAVLAGLCAGFAAWTKFEGGFHAAALVLVAVGVWRATRATPLFVAGALPGAAITIYFLTSIAPRNAFVSANPVALASAILARLIDFNYFGWAVTPVVVLAVYAWLVGLSPSAGGWRRIWIPVIGLFLAGCVGVMVRDDNSGDSAAIRLVMHVWPAVIAALFLHTKTVEELAVPANAPAKARKQSGAGGGRAVKP